jgi:hypothetical protein
MVLVICHSHYKSQWLGWKGLRRIMMGFSHLLLHKQKHMANACIGQDARWSLSALQTFLIVLANAAAEAGV